MPGKATSKKKQKRKKQQKKNTAANNAVRLEIAGLLTVVAGLLLLLSLYYDGMGYVGLIFRTILMWALGRAAWVIPLVLVGAGILYLVSVRPREMASRLWGLLLSTLILSAIYHGILGAEEPFTPQVMVDGGGYTGAVIAWALTSAVGTVGMNIILTAGMIASLLLIVNTPMTELVSGAVRGIGAAARAAYSAFMGFFTWEREEEDDSDSLLDRVEGPGTELTEDVAIHSYPDDGEPGPDGRSNGRVLPFKRSKTEDAAPDKKKDKGKGVRVPEELEQLKMDVNILYKLPDPSLLSRPESRRFLPGRTRDELNRKARLLESTLESFGLRCKVTDISHGPTITRFDMHPGPGVKVSQIVNLADDISLSLATSGVRVVAPVPGKSAVGIEVPNRKVSSVLLREILESKEFKRSPDPLTLALGSDITGRPVVVRLADLLHLLIAGATGSGKSICIRCIIASILFKARPDEVKLILIDPKVVELMSYVDLPHLLTPVVTDSRKAAGCLTWAVKEMERRYKEFAARGVRDISGYNRKALETGGEPMPRIVIIIDELADLMMVARVDVEDAIQRLAQMARAAGIHLVVATQRPSVDVITGVIKANIPSRLAFAVSSGADSRIILDSSGAERLMGNGDMLLSPVGRDKSMRAQGSFVSDEDLEKLLQWVKEHGSPDYLDEVMVAANEGPESEINEDEDPKVEEAIEVVLQNGEASVSMLQRKLRVGYTRAGRLIDILENMGVVGSHQGPKPREVLITRAQYRQQTKDQEESEAPSP